MFWRERERERTDLCVYMAQYIHVSPNCSEGLEAVTPQGGLRSWFLIALPNKRNQISLQKKAASKAGARKILDEPGASCSARK